MALAFGVLRWPPDTFWRATPRELAAAMHLPAKSRAVQPATSEDVQRLMQAFPDDVRVIPGRAEGPNPEPTT